MATCVHHWKCGEPQGPVIPAFCRRCGATREFRPDVSYAEIHIPHPKETPIHFGIHYETGLAR